MRDSCVPMVGLRTQTKSSFDHFNNNDLIRLVMFSPTFCWWAGLKFIFFLEKWQTQYFATIVILNTKVIINYLVIDWYSPCSWAVQGRMGTVSSSSRKQRYSLKVTRTTFLSVQSSESGKYWNSTFRVYFQHGTITLSRYCSDMQTTQ